jgi:hypothetical protein
VIISCSYCKTRIESDLTKNLIFCKCGRVGIETTNGISKLFWAGKEELKTDYLEHQDKKESKNERKRVSKSGKAA